MPLQAKTRCAARATGSLEMPSARTDASEFSTRREYLQAPRYDLRFRRQVEAVHRLGPHALSCLLEEIARGADLRERVERYARLDCESIKAFGGDQFPSALHVGGIA
jgi:hypothetical protein